MSIFMEIGELAARAGVTRRTIRYYSALGLLPPGEDRGRSRVFNLSHLARLNLIRVLKDQFLPLDEIRKRMDEMTEEEIAAAAGTGSRVKSATPPPVMMPMRMRESSSLHYRLHETPQKMPVTPEDAPPAWTREELYPGIELHVHTRPDKPTSILAGEIRRIARAFRKSAYRDPEASG